MEGEIWVGISFAKEYRLMISYQLGKTESVLAEPLIAKTENCLKDGQQPVWVSDGLDAYGAALKQRHCILKEYPRTGKQGRPRRPKLVACPQLRYGQVVKHRDERGHLIDISKRCVYGDIPLETISTVHIERHNLNLRHENRRLTRKTIAFSKKFDWLDAQMCLYQAFFNFVRTHRGLKNRSKTGKTLQKWHKRTPAMAASLTKHIWSLKELMTKKIFINH